MNEIDELVFCLTERLDDVTKSKQKDVYNSIRNIYVTNQNTAEENRNQFETFFKNLLMISGCDHPNDYMRRFHVFLNNAFDNPDFENIKTNGILCNLSYRTNPINVYKWCKDMIIENEVLKSKIDELHHVHDYLLNEKKYIEEEEMLQNDGNVKNRAQENLIKRNNKIIGDLYMCIDDLNRDISKHIKENIKNKKIQSAKG